MSNSRLNAKKSKLESQQLEAQFVELVEPLPIIISSGSCEYLEHPESHQDHHNDDTREKEITDLKFQLQIYQEHIKIRDKRIEEKDSQYAALKQLYDSQTTTIKNLQDNAVNLESKIEEKDSLVSTLMGMCKTQIDHAEILQHTTEEQELQLTELKTSLKTSLDSEEEIKQLKGYVNTLEKGNRERTEMINEISAEKRQIVAKLQANIIELAKQLKKSESDKVRLEQTIKSLETKIASDMKRTCITQKATGELSDALNRFGLNQSGQHNIEKLPSHTPKTRMRNF